jgi:sec-independent protein translocase protein TatA
MFQLAFINFPGGTEWVLIFLAILLLFGGRTIPELMRGIGKGIREFNTARGHVKEEIKKGMEGEDEETKKSDKEQ